MRDKNSNVETRRHVQWVSMLLSRVTTRTPLTICSR